jgi:acetyl-CoA acetyltransferase
MDGPPLTALGSPFRPVAVVSFAQTPPVPRTELNDVELVMPSVTKALAQVGLDRHAVGFTVSGSSDFLTGMPFSFVAALDGVGAWPPIQESHVEMDGAWALYEAWVRLQHGDIDTALVYAFGRSSLGDLGDVLTMQLDPYYVAPLWPDHVSLAVLQARALLDTGRYSERDFAEISARRRNSKVSAVLDEPYLVAPLRQPDCPPVSDSAAAIILAAGDRAKTLAKRPAWITGIDHRIEPHSLGARDLTRSPSTEKCAHTVGLAKKRVEVAELHAPFSHEELILREALGVSAPGSDHENPVMVAGLTRIGHAAQAILDGKAACTLAHATSGPCLQQNLVCLMEAQS